MSKLRSCLCACFTLLAALLWGAALAEGATPLPLMQPTPMPIVNAPEQTVVWRVIAPDIDTEALQAETFDVADLAAVQAEQRRSSSVFWSLGEGGAPFCGISHSRGAEDIQARFDIYRHADDGEERTYYYNLDMWNTIPEESGFDAPGAVETVLEGQSLLARLGLVTEDVAPAPVSFSTLGRMEGTTRCRKAVFVETLKGLPVRWSAGSLTFLVEEQPQFIVEPCYVTVTYSDEDGLLMLEGAWCSFEPLQAASELVTAAEALALFQGAGLADQDTGAAALEACWFLSRDGQGVTATLAWRKGNSYLSAVDGTWLQTETGR